MRRAKTHWTPEMDELLRSLYPTRPWSEIQKAFPGAPRHVIYHRANKLGVSRWNQGQPDNWGKIARGEATEAEIGWLAGFVDGEGTLQLAVKHQPLYPPRKHLTRTYLAPSITVVNTHKPSLLKTRELMGGNWMNLRENLWGVRIQSLIHVQRVLVVLIPHLTCKAERAELLLEYARVRQGKPGRAPYGPEEEALYQRFYHGSGRHGASRRPRNLNHYANPEPSSSR